jgi:hypothetical protein
MPQCDVRDTEPPPALSSAGRNEGEEKISRSSQFGSAQALPVCVSVCLFVCVCLSVRLSVCLSVCVCVIA